MPKTLTSSDKTLFTDFLNNEIDSEMKAIMELIDVEMENGNIQIIS